MATDTPDPARIERDLDQTRTRLGSNLNTLQDRFSPGQVVDDLLAYVRGNEGAEFGRNLMDSVRQNPLPAALTGIGLAWLMASNPRPTNADAAPHAGEDFSARLRTAERRVARQSDEPEHLYAERLTEARGHAVGIARDAEESQQSYTDRVSDAVERVRQTAADGFRAARDGAGNVAGSVSGAVGSAGASLQSAAQSAGGALSRGSQAATHTSGNLIAGLTESPVLLGALGLTAGALLGSLLPQSDAEEDLLGGVAGQARQTANELAASAMDRGTNVAHAAMEAGQDSAKQHGLAEGKSPGQMLDSALSGDLASNAKNVAQDALRAGDEAARKQTT